MEKEKKLREQIERGRLKNQGRLPRPIKDYTSNPESVENIDPMMIKIDSDFEKETYYNLMLNTTSFPAEGKPTGYTIKYLVLNKFDNKYLGMIEITGNWTAYAVAASILGKKCKNIFNIRAVMPLQPFGFNFAGGKLLALLAVSDKVLKDWCAKYPTRPEILYVVTISTGPSPNQYDSLKYFKAKGYTKKGHKRYWCELKNIPDRSYDKLIELWRDRYGRKRSEKLIQTGNFKKEGHDQGDIFKTVPSQNELNVGKWLKKPQ